MAWTTPKTWTADELVTATDLNTHLRDNLLALKAPPSDQKARDNNANYTTTSTSFVDVDGTNLSITLTTAGGDVLLWFMGVSAGYYSSLFTFAVDGTDLGEGDGLAAAFGTLDNTVTMVYLVTGLFAGSHTFKLRYRTVTSGTAQLYSGTTTNYKQPVIFGAREI